ncbi:rhamnan synthesis F family protein [Silvimonas sp.]|uniref:rhamnan synthesis F family protein n=1 Tax=Silvimonas sp. TaxID=2650811 RepID=UPI0028436F71|nr:rhamnan synthesis F family protein [Silvimonas sp.]MDR3429435.1 rhamnan synthesis F family protein [Silvimonas sp.]
MKRVAIIAHYDVNGVIDAYLKRLLEQVASLCDRVVLVSTSGPMDTFSVLPAGVEVISRENKGYDFCSYRFGIEAIDGIEQYDQLLVLNDSFYCGPRFDLAKLLSSTNGDIVGLTASRQFNFHLQSYFLVFNKRAIQSRWFWQFWARVVPLKDKLQIVFRYEIGLSQTAMDAGLNLTSILLVQDASEPSSNPVHQMFELVYRELGIIKVDLFRLNIQSKSVAEVVQNDDFAQLIISHQERTAKHYEGKKLSFDNTVQLAGGFFDFVRSGDRKASVAVVLHLFYPELAAGIAEYLERIPVDVDLYISITNYAHLDEIVAAFRRRVNSIYVYVVENRGRDVRPFLLLLKNANLLQYTAVLKIHGKKSKYSERGDEWRDALLSGLLPQGKNNNLGRMLRRFEKDPTLGIAAPRSSYLSNENYWGANKSRIFEYGGRLGLTPDQIELFFVGGTMFWFSPRALLPLVNIIRDEDFESENGQQDGTLAHATERLFCLAAHSNGMSCTYIDSLDERADSVRVGSNRIIVLPH